MKVNGIVAEYNPLHSGHKYQLEDAKKHTGADYTVVVMSGNFVQRGAPALLDKYKRAHMALSCGADLVLELPACCAVASAEYFAMGAASLLDKLGVVDYLCFGSECGDIPILQQIAEILAREPEAYAAALRASLRQGHSYPSARTRALIQYAPHLGSCREVLSSPNNILGIEYLKALCRLGSPMVPCTTKRLGADYHDSRFGECQCSALAIREAVFSGQDSAFLKSHMPGSAYAILLEALQETSPLCANDFSAVLHYKLLQESGAGYDRYLDVSPELSGRIRNNLYSFCSFRDFCDLLKSRDMTYTRISRCLLHILLGLDNETMHLCKSLGYAPYARVLGFRREAEALLAAIKERASIPMITKLADAGNHLEGDALAMLQKEIRINEIYLSAAAVKAGRSMGSECSVPIVIL